MRRRRNPNRPRHVVSDFLFGIHAALRDVLARSPSLYRAGSMQRAMARSDAAGEAFRRGAIQKAKDEGKEAVISGLEVPDDRFQQRLMDAMRVLTLDDDLLGTERSKCETCGKSYEQRESVRRGVKRFTRFCCRKHEVGGVYGSEVGKVYRDRRRRRSNPGMTTRDMEIASGPNVGLGVVYWGQVARVSEVVGYVRPQRGVPNGGWVVRLRRFNGLGSGSMDGPDLGHAVLVSSPKGRVEWRVNALDVSDKMRDLVSEARGRRNNPSRRWREHPKRKR